MDAKMVGSLEASLAEKKAARWAVRKAGYLERKMADYSGWKRVAMTAAKTEMCLAEPMDMSKAAYSAENSVA